MTGPTELLLQAQALIHDHQPEAARRILQSVLRQEPANEAAWWFYIGTFEKRSDRIAILEAFAREFPDHPRLPSLIKKVKSEGRSSSLSDTRPMLTGNCVPGKVTAAKARPKLGFLPWAILVCCLLFMLASLPFAYRVYSDLEQRFNILIEKYLILDQAFKDLSEQYVGLLSEFDGLNRIFSSLQRDYQSLEDQHKLLQTDFISLKSTYDELSVDYLDLETGYNDLVKSYITLDQQALKPPYIYIHQREIWMAFFRDNGELFYWGFPLKTWKIPSNGVIQPGQTRFSCTLSKSRIPV